ncbi:MAG: hypothetical protein H6901_08160 [Rhodobacteraceae bacterium]|nr:hypothetical protein [Paracoccaceae bacterium]MCP5342173.1 hypothetical protein [Paracoccaceae bacterium]
MKYAKQSSSVKKDIVWAKANPAPVYPLDDARTVIPFATRARSVARQDHGRCTKRLRKNVFDVQIRQAKLTPANDPSAPRGQHAFHRIISNQGSKFLGKLLIRLGAHPHWNTLRPIKS